jgi:hypothetical protein
VNKQRTVRRRRESDAPPTIVKGWTEKSEKQSAAMADARMPSLTPYVPSVRTYMSMM